MGPISAETPLAIRCKTTERGVKTLNLDKGRGPKSAGVGGEIKKLAGKGDLSAGWYETRSTLSPIESRKKVYAALAHCPYQI
jgi:hypothetical protein